MGVLNDAMDYLATVDKTTIMPSAGASYAGYGGAYYEIYGRVIHIHLGLKDLAVNADNIVYTLPSNLKPVSVGIHCVGMGGSRSEIIDVWVYDNGQIMVHPNTTGFCVADIVYMI